MNFYFLLADIVLIVHATFVGFVVLGLVMILIGLQQHWHWVRNFWFRVLHLLAIGIVVLQSWLGIICPLTLWENQLRLLGKGTAYSGSFIAHWLHELIFYRAETWVFTLSYSLFAGLVIITWIWGTPQIPFSLVLKNRKGFKMKTP